MKTIAIVAALGVLAIPAFALASAPQDFHGGHGGNLTRQQAADRADQIFARADSNRDGRLTRAEAQQAHQQLAGTHRPNSGGGHAGRGGHGFFETMFGKRGAVTKADFRKQHLTLFARLDRNRDGVVGAAEHQAAQSKH